MSFLDLRADEDAFKPDRTMLGITLVVLTKSSSASILL
jgi:hypothetical protein